MSKFPVESLALTVCPDGHTHITIKGEPICQELLDVAHTRVLCCGEDALEKVACPVCRRKGKSLIDGNLEEAKKNQEVPLQKDGIRSPRTIIRIQEGLNYKMFCLFLIVAAIVFLSGGHSAALQIVIIAAFVRLTWIFIKKFSLLLLK